ncbi:uncharacterized protein [Typha angustifolia]|uniref:uncharacterized protein n=1 Tax=Typha angustifolia TaxID=59011 RepID=UPI003C2B5A3A
MKESEVLGYDLSEKGSSQVTAATASLTSNRLEPVTKGHSPLEQDVAYLNKSHAGSVKSSTVHGYGAPSECDKENNKLCFPKKVDEERAVHKMNSGILGLDLNAVDTSSIVDYNPFCPFKKLGQLKSADSLECGSTTGPVEESEPLKMWKEMKQNGFLSSLHGGVQESKQRGRQPRKKKDDGCKKKTEFARKEQVNRFMKVAAPSGLLSGLNPGIINHVRNSKQVRSIIEAIVRSEKHDTLEQSRLDQTGPGSKEHIGRGKEHNIAHTSLNTPCSLPLNKPFVPPERRMEINQLSMAEQRFYHGKPTPPQLIEEDENERLKLKLASTVTTCTSADNFSASTDNITSLSLKAATVASQWLELLQHDIKGRLDALKRSKKRVRNVIHTELPYLLSTELSSSQENVPSMTHSLEAGCSEEAISETHAAQWRSLFIEMDKTLHEEARGLESWLRQVQEMRVHCEKGLKYAGVEVLPQLESIDDLSKLKKSEAFEHDCAVKAAAASIYSTCNLIMTTENIP